ncbi:RNase adaptor protein RapZ [Moraxella caviae]|uniref:GlmZ(SRNA)-inactivating NTPase n=1 Tax=Moraxella caviae TaxID=34060 RepID=A0A1T0A9G9_9GAMM|nr:RNase adapter RapZ [Moraxella caviae]OOR92364.1 RNase adaptor protein RapZ [Moraxella caviae]STZ10567.1 glmZ(sRNA)-inactivating NTPase [Moraxella caviae]
MTDTQTTPQIIIVSGRSGSGKTSVLNILEDFAYYAIDNLPLSLVVDAVAKLTAENIHKIALGVDARAPKADLTNFPVIYDSLVATYGADAIKILYVTAQEGVLVARFGATRRVHPLMATKNNLPNAIHSEIALLEPIATRADIKIDTSTLNIHELKEKVADHLGVDGMVRVNLLSFGFKYGTPIDADFVFDVRILPNPHWREDLRAQTGNDAAVREFFAQYPEVDAMAEDIARFLNDWLPNFLYNNRYSITVTIGCTGGKHRSVYVTEKVAKLLDLPANMPIVVKHREKRYW